MSAWATGGALAGGIVGGVLQNQANAREAQRNRDFQEYMSNTSHQRQVKDLKAAGLNPLLSATGGASTPTGAQATAENVVQGGIASAQEAQKIGLSSKMNAAQLENLNSQNKLLKAQTNKAQMETHVMSKDIPKADIVNELYQKGKGVFDKIGEQQKNSAKEPSFNIKEHRFYERAKEHNRKRITEPFNNLYKRKP